jgi:transcriptional regulator with XRE-family HTH domain
MVTIEQIRAARGYLGWNQRDLAAKAGISPASVKAYEGGKNVRVSIRDAIERALVDAGIMFLEPGDTRDGGRRLRVRQ